MCIRDSDELLTAPRRVAERIEPVNESLGRSPYDRGRFLSICLLYTSDAADERSSVDLGGRRIIKKKTKRTHGGQYHAKRDMEG